MLIAWFCLLLLGLEAPLESGIDWLSTEIPADSAHESSAAHQPPPK